MVNQLASRGLESQPQEVSRLEGFRRWVLSDPRVLVTGGFLLILCFTALAAPLITSEDPMRIVSGRQFLPPGGEGGFLGTDEAGRDIFARIIYGSRLTLGVSIGAVAIAMTLGVTMGMVAAFVGRYVDMLLMRLVDAILIFPGILVAMFIISFWGASIGVVIGVIGFLYSAQFARIAYGTTLSVKEFDYVLASRAIGARPVRLLSVAILPNILTPLMVQASLAMGTAILLESSLSFLGLGPPEIASWGRSIQRSSRFMEVHPWGVIWPALMISLTVLAFNILGDALRDKLDPRLR
jgi:peptide/nickel transport system permease protein